METNICKILGDNIKKLRKRRSLTQNELAELICIEVKSLSLIETGKGFVSAKTLEKLAYELKVQVSELFKVSDEQEGKIIYSEIISNLNLIKDNTDKLKTLNFVLKV